MNLNIYKTSNEIQDICICNGVCRLLDMNFINWNLINNKSSYLIECDEIDFENIYFTEIDIGECYTCNSTFNRKELADQINSCNEFFNKNIKYIFEYFLTNNDFILKNFESDGSIGIGSYFNLKSVRASTSHKSLRISEHIRHLAFLGWIYSTNFIQNDNFEINSLMIPKGIDRILRPHEFSYIDKETHEKKILHKFSKNSKKSDVVMLGEIYLNTVLDYFYYKDTFDKIIFMTLTPTANKPLANKSFDLPIYNWSRPLYEKLSNLLNYSTVAYDVKDITAKYIIQPTFLNYKKLIDVYSKNEQLLPLDYKEDLLKMYNNRVQEITNNTVVQKVGTGLKYLLLDKKGFEILTYLYSVKKVKNLHIRIQEILDCYSRVKKYDLINATEYQELINLINTNEDAKICSTAIISYARVFYEKKATSSNKPETTNKGTLTDVVSKIK